MNRTFRKLISNAVERALDFPLKVFPFPKSMPLHMRAVWLAAFFCLVVIICTILSGCVTRWTYSKADGWREYVDCVDILYFDYGDKGKLQKVDWYQGKMFFGSYWETSGFVYSIEYKGLEKAYIRKEGRCTNDILYHGLYDMYFPTAGNVIGHGVGNWIMVLPNRVYPIEKAKPLSGEEE